MVHGIVLAKLNVGFCYTLCSIPATGTISLFLNKLLPVTYCGASESSVELLEHRFLGSMPRVVDSVGRG